MFFRPFSFYRDVNSPSSPQQPGGGLDPNAEAFLTATGITDETITDAINNLVLDLKSNNLWTLMNAIYPFVGGTADTHKYNLLDPQDTNNAFRITWSGTITHNSNGVIPNGTNGYGNTNMNANTQLSGGAAQNDCHAFMYFNSTSARNGADFGASTISPAAAFSMNSRNASNIFNTAGMSADVSDGAGNTGTSGCYGFSRNNSSNYIKFFNTSQSTVTRASAAPPNVTIVLGAQNRGGTIQNFQNRTISMMTLGFALSSTDIDNLVSINETFQTALGRFA